MLRSNFHHCLTFGFFNKFQIQLKLISLISEIMKLLPVLIIWLIVHAPIQAAEENLVKIYMEDLEGGGYNLIGTNLDAFPHFVMIELNKLENLKSSQPSSYEVSIPANTNRKLLLQVTPDDYSLGYRIKYSYSHIPGNPELPPDIHHAYLFPFKHGTKHKVDQGFFGKSTHTGHSKYALDFGMPIGTPVYASRGGIVFNVIDHNTIGGPEPEYKPYGNRIQIFHKDGTIASYVHLKENGSLVQKGQNVIAGEHIGYSGNTGLSSGPHLHFEVSRPTKSGNLTSIRIALLNHEKQLTSPKQGKYYYATHPGGQPFQITFGQDLQNHDFETYQKKIAQTNDVSFREIKFDDTRVMFIQNGKPYFIEATIRSQLMNMESSKRLPLTLTLPPLTERFCFLLKSINNEDASQYSISSSYRQIN